MLRPEGAAAAAAAHGQPVSASLLTNPCRRSEMPKANPITVVHNFGGRRAPADGPTQVQTWGLWDCDPSKTGRKPSQCVTNSSAAEA